MCLKPHRHVLPLKPRARGLQPNVGQNPKNNDENPPVAKRTDPEVFAGSSLHPQAAEVQGGRRGGRPRSRTPRTRPQTVALFRVGPSGSHPPRGPSWLRARRGGGALPRRGQPGTHLPVLVVDKDVAGAVVLQVGDLQAMGVADLGRLEGGVQMFDLHDGLGLLGLEARPCLSSGWAGERAVRSCGRWLCSVALGKVLTLSGPGFPDP